MTPHGLANGVNLTRVPMGATSMVPKDEVLRLRPKAICRRVRHRGPGRLYVVMDEGEELGRAGSSPTAWSRALKKVRGM